MLSQVLDFLDQLLTNPWSGPAAVLVGLVAGLVLHLVLQTVLVRFSKRGDTALELHAVRRLRAPSRLLLPLLGLQLALPAAGLDPQAANPLQHGIAVTLILLVAWFLIAAIESVESVILARHRLDVRDNLLARRVHTQLRVLTRVAAVIIGVVAVAGILMTFPRIRQLGLSLMASAGVVGLVAGLAARPTLSNLIAGLQIALAAPIQLDDVVIVEGEWGRIEEITGTYVVVRIWDDRRLVVPLTWFLEHPFQNWTRRTSDLLGTVFLHVDFATPLDELRQELKRLCEGSPHWDERVCLVQVTDTTDRALVVRALVSARDSASLFDLRCLVREGLTRYLNEHHPGALPRVRAEVAGGPPFSEARS